MDTSNFKLQFITQPSEKISIIDEVTAVLQGGCRWIQLRMKDSSENKFIDIGLKIKQLCKSYQATFIINDYAELVKVIGADGVHLGINDMPISQARQMLGDNYIIGATANNFEHIVHASKQQADYIGLGPYKFTTTKKNLSPILGLNGYQQIIEQCIKNDIHLPIVAIGGIEIADIQVLLQTKIAGIAMSGTLLHNANIKQQTELVIKEINNNR